jgi:arsenite methyltransferase
VDSDAIKAAVREYYARRVSSGSCCEATADATSCCGPAPAGVECGTLESTALGARNTEEIPSYGCGTPFEAHLFRHGDVIVDLGSGPGRDAFVAARAVGPAGRVIGVDMTTEMIERARGTASRAGVGNVEFRLGDIEALPVADKSADVVISNCVLTLVPDKGRALAEAFRILRPGGRLIVNDIVATTTLPDALRADLQLWSQCVSGAVIESEYRRLLVAVGFVDIAVVPNGEGIGALPTFSARVTARRP